MQILKMKFKLSFLKCVLKKKHSKEMGSQFNSSIILFLNIIILYWK